VVNVAKWLEELEKPCPAGFEALLERAALTLQNNIIDVCPPSGELPRWIREKNPDMTEEERLTLPPWRPLRGICPSISHYPGVWNWDSAFHAMTVARWGPELASEQVEIFLNAQLADGMLVDAIFANGHVIDSFGKPPVMPWAATVVDSYMGSSEWIGKVYPAFVRYEEFWRVKRGGDEDGLFHYVHSFESGWDKSPRFDDGVDTILPVDLNCYMVLFYRALAYMAERCGSETDVEHWRQREAALADTVNGRLFDAARGCYYDYDKARECHTGVLTPASLMPLYIGIADHAMASAVAEPALDEKKLYPSFPTVAFDHPAYAGDGKTYSWRGPTWLNVAFFALQGLKRYGMAEQAEKSRDLLLEWCARGDSIHECYGAADGDPRGAPAFGWSAAFVIEMLLGWDDHLDRFPCVSPVARSGAPRA